MRGEQFHPALQHSIPVVECPQHVSRQNEIEGRLRKGRLCRVALYEIDVRSCRQRFRSRQPNHVAGNIDPGDPVALFGEEDSEATRSTTEIRNPSWLLWDQWGQ